MSSSRPSQCEIEHAVRHSARTCTLPARICTVWPALALATQAQDADAARRQDKVRRQFEELQLEREIALEIVKPADERRVLGEDWLGARRRERLTLHQILPRPREEPQ